jgi:hypothetical protein
MVFVACFSSFFVLAQGAPAQETAGEPVEEEHASSVPA